MPTWTAAGAPQHQRCQVILQSETGRATSVECTGLVTCLNLCNRKLCSRSTRDHGTAQAEIDCCDSYYARLADIRAGRTRSLELRITGNSGALRASKTADAPPSPAPPRPGSAEDGARTDSASSAVLQGTAGSLARYLQQQDMCGKNRAICHDLWGREEKKQTDPTP